MFTHIFKLRVRYSETDKMGYLYYGNYPQYYEVGRAEAIRDLGISYQELEDVHQIMMPVMTLNMRYVRPAHYDDLLTIHTTVKKLPTSTITFHMDIYNEKEELLNGGLVKLCFVDMITNKSIPCPAYLLDKLAPFFND